VNLGLASLIGRLELNRAISRQADGPWRLQQAKRLKKRLQKHFEKQQTFVLREAKSLSFFGRRKNAVDPADEKEIDLLVSRIPEKDAIAETLAIYWRASMLKGGKSTVRQLKLGQAGISFSLKNKEAIKWLKAKKIIETAEPMSTEWIKARNVLKLSDYKGNIAHTTKQEIKKILVAAAESGQSYTTTAKQIAALSDEGIFSAARGQRIAVFEIGSAYQVGGKIPMEDFASQFPDRQPEKKWVTAASEICPDCLGYQSLGWRELNYSFGGHDTPPAHVNCRCSLVWQVPPLKKV